MKKIGIKALFAALIIGVGACQTVDYEWENFEYVATPKVSVNTALSALPTVPSANVSFFNMADPDYATEQFFEWELDYYDAGGRAEVSSIEVYVSFNKKESTPPVYPIVLSLAEVHPNERQFPLPSLIKDSDLPFEVVREFPKVFRFNAAQLAEITGTDLNTVGVNDYFLFKFVINQTDGKRIVQFSNNSCDESRGELADCRVGVRFKNQ
ncbi:MAG TPA: hypothetical protein VK014_09575 [Cyclobacteriaceae bacterium]|nr:hypothetical protein [Cyclobacteriaceae bacterium]